MKARTLRTKIDRLLYYRVGIEVVFDCIEKFFIDKLQVSKNSICSMVS